jgi:hypothetical protein
MSLLIQIEQEDRIVDGELREVGEIVRVPNALAVHLRKKGFASWADGDAHAREAARKIETRKAHEKLETRAAKRKAS